MTGCGGDGAEESSSGPTTAAAGNSDAGGTSTDEEESSGLGDAFREALAAGQQTANEGVDGSGSETAASAGQPRATPEPADDDPAVPGKIIPLPVKEGEFALTPRTQTEAEIDAWVKQISVTHVYVGYDTISVQLYHPPESNLNKGPSGLRATNEGAKMWAEIDKVTLADGSSAPFEQPRSMTQRYHADENRFSGAFGIPMNRPVGRDEIGSVSGELVVLAPVGIKTVKIERTEERKSVEYTPVEGLTLSPNWFTPGMSVEFAEGCRRKFVHVRAFHKSGREVRISGGAHFKDLRDEDAGRSVYFFEGEKNSVHSLLVYVAPSHIERRIPFEVSSKKN